MIKLLEDSKIVEVFTRLQQYNPQPRTELIYHSHFELLIAVILSAQATDIGVNKATVKLFTVANTPESILALGLEKLSHFIRSIGLYQSKAKHILATCQQLLQSHQGQVPQDRKALQALPGVGRKTANVILNTAFGEKVIAVDTHIFRVAKRLGLTDGKTVLAVEQQLQQRIPDAFLKNAHHHLILHGRYICKARKALCEQCILQDLCPTNGI